MKLKWKIINVWQSEFIWQNDLEKKTFVLQQFEDVQHPWSLQIDAIGDNVSLLQWINDWDYVEVFFNTKAIFSENHNRYFNNISMWKIKNLDKPEVDEDTPF
jgi:hypothetical protein